MDGIDFTKLVPAADFYGEDPEDQRLLLEMIERGHSWLVSHNWCKSIAECYVGDIAVGGIVVVLLVQIIPSSDDVDEWLWLIVGDVPPAYLVTDDAPNPATALAIYLDLVKEWVSAAEQGDDVSGLMPINTPDGDEPLTPTSSNAEALGVRIESIQRLVLDYHQDDLRHH
jgi:hypothetical protein